MADPQFPPVSNEDNPLDGAVRVSYSVYSIQINKDQSVIVVIVVVVFGILSFMRT